MPESIGKRVGTYITKTTRPISFNNKISKIIDQQTIKNDHILPMCEDNSLLILHHNVQSIRNKISEIEIFLNRSPCHIFCVNEHWLYNDESTLYIPEGYELASIYCRSKITHGGVAIFVNKKYNLHYNTISVEKFCKEEEFEIVALSFPKVKLILVSVYRTPVSDVNVFSEQIEKLTTFLEKYKNYKIVYVGDINIDIRDKCQQVNFFLNTLKSCNLYCINDQPTRQNSCLDNIITNIKTNNLVYGVVETMLSDHRGIWLLIESENLEKQTTTHFKNFRLLGIVNINNLRHKLSIFDWEVLYQGDDINNIFSIFMNILANILKDSCPRVCKKVNNNVSGKSFKLTKWYTPHLQALRNTLMVLYNRCKLGNSVDHENYRLARKQYRAEIQLAKKKANDRYIEMSNNKCKAAWKIINSLSGIQKGRKAVPISPNVLNNYFVNSTNNVTGNEILLNDNNTDMTKNILQHYIPEQHNMSFKWTRVTSLEIYSIVAKLGSSHSEDFYGFSNFIFKSIIDIIVIPLTYLINLMLSVGVYPESLKITLVVPVYKKGDKKSPDSYRPISLVPIVSKVIEHCIKEQLCNYFESNHLISSSHFGFRSGLSTVKAVESLVSVILEGYENYSYSCAMLLDLSKAFDTVSHDILLAKLHYYGLSGFELSLIKSYLCNRCQIVTVENRRSETLYISNGVPQGSVLGPFLFLVYINDLPGFLPYKSILYADDTTFITVDVDLDKVKSKNNEMIEKSAIWLHHNKLILNHNKTETMYFYLHKLNHEINECKSIKLLGIHLDPKLTWNVHTQQLCTKLSRVIFLLRKLKYLVSEKQLLSAYYAFFHSHVLYGISLWGNSTGAQTVLKWQKKAVRIIKGIASTESCRPHFRDLKILTVPSLYIITCLLFIKKHINIFSTRSAIHDHNTRNSNDLETQFMRLGKCQSSFKFTGVKLFNKLPMFVRDMPIKHYDRYLKRLLVDTCIYSVQEFELFVCQVTQ